MAGDLPLEQIFPIAIGLLLVLIAADRWAIFHLDMIHRPRRGRTQAPWRRPMRAVMAAVPRDADDITRVMLRGIYRLFAEDGVGV